MLSICDYKVWEISKYPVILQRLVNNSQKLSGGSEITVSNESCGATSVAADAVLL